MHGSIRLTDWTLTGIATPVLSVPESNGNEGELCIPQIPRFEPHHQMQFNVLPGNSKSCFS